MTTPHERDGSLDRWLDASLPRTGEATDSCLDGEMAAAWLDGGLDAASHQQAEAHISSCARCQTLVASVVAMEAAETAAVAPVPSRWRAWLNWMVPLGALATAGLALAIWLNVPAPSLREAAAPGQSRVEPPAPAVAEAPTTTAAEAGRRPVDSPRGQPGTAPDTARKAAAPPAPEPGRADGSLAAAPAAGASTDPSARALTGASRAAANETAAPPPAEAPPPAAAPARLAAPRALDAPAPLAAQDAVVSQASAGRDTAGPEIVSPDGQVRWRLDGRVVSRSADRGATWATTVADATGRLLAGAAPSATVCWVVGEGGLVLRSLDGVRFARVAPPAGVNLTSVSAASAGNAVVGSADGRRFVTADGGATWQAAP